MNTLAIHCGKCKGYHNTQSEVRDCFLLGQPVTTAQVAQAQAPKGTVPTWAKFDGAWFVRVPKGQAHEGDTVLVHRKDGTTAEHVLGVEYHADGANCFFNAKKAQAQPQPLPPNPAGTNLVPDVPEGHYAVASATGNNDLDFYRVDRPTEGKWAGYTFVKRVIGGKADIRIKSGQANDALERIAAAGIKDAALLYGKEIGQCCRCNRHLTDETSRAFGMGPDCRQIVGW